ncbi:MAG: DUF721 domain-containing protein [Acidobacteriia bacterium]|nr:DUF721 domain-containing protein [Terriglobia bacterium]
MKHISHSMPQLLRRWKQSPTLAINVWQNLWMSNVGDSTARHSKVLRCEFRRLVVAVDSPVWMKELERLKPDLILTFNRICGRKTLTDLEFVRVDYLSNDGGAKRTSDPL